MKIKSFTSLLLLFAFGIVRSQTFSSKQRKIEKDLKLIANVIRKFLLIFFLVPFVAVAQNKDEAKKIEAQLATEKDSHKKLTLYLDLLNNIGDYDSIATEKYVIETSKLADKLNDKKSKAEAIRQLAVMYMTFNNVPKALPVFNKSLELAQSINDKILVGDIYNNISNAYGLIHNNKLVDEYMMKALKEYQLQNAEPEIAMVYVNLGSNYSRRGEYAKSIDYFLKSLAIRERLHNDKGVGNVAFNITYPYKFLKRYDEAVKYNQLAIEKFTLVKNEGMLASAYAVKGSLLRNLKQYDEAISYINKALPLFEKYKNRNGIRNCYDNIGLLYIEKKDLNNALKYFFMSKQISVDMNDPQGIVSADINIAQTALDLKDLKTANSIINEAEPLAKKYNFKEDLGELYKLKHDYAIEKNDGITAKQSFDNYLKLKDSLSNIEVNQQISELQTRYNTEKKENQIRILNNEKHINLLQLKNQNLTLEQNRFLIDKQNQAITINQLEIKNKNQLVKNQQLDANKKAQDIKSLKKQSQIQNLEIQNKKLELKQKNTWLIFGGILFLTTLISAFFIYRNYQHKQDKKLQKEIFLQQELATKSLFEGEQNERIRIARDLHDSVGQMLSLVKMNLSSQEQNPENENIQSLVDKTISEVRNISHNLIPEELNFGIFPALENLSDKVNSSSKTKIKLQIPEEIKTIKFQKQNELSIYRIVQEVVNNMIKHADASSINIEISKLENSLIINIKDNGKGLDDDSITNSSGIGWKNINARVHMMDGKIKIESEKLAGTQIEITLPQNG